MSRSIDDLKGPDGGIDARAVSGGAPAGEFAPPFPAGACREAREAVANGTTVRDLAAEQFPDRHYSTVRHHVVGICDHDHGVPPLEYRGHAPTGQWVVQDGGDA